MACGGCQALAPQLEGVVMTNIGGTTYEDVTSLGHEWEWVEGGNGPADLLLIGLKITVVATDGDCHVIYNRCREKTPASFLVTWNMQAKVVGPSSELPDITVRLPAGSGGTTTASPESIVQHSVLASTAEYNFQDTVIIHCGSDQTFSFDAAKFDVTIDNYETPLMDPRPATGANNGPSKLRLRANPCKDS